MDGIEELTKAHYIASALRPDTRACGVAAAARPRRRCHADTMSWQLRSAGVASVCALCLAIYVLGKQSFISRSFLLLSCAQQGRYAHWRIRTYGVEYHANLYLPHTRRILVDTCEIRGVDVFKDVSRWPHTHLPFLGYYPLLAVAHGWR